MRERSRTGTLPIERIQSSCRFRCRTSYNLRNTTAGDRIALVDEFGNLVIYTGDGLTQALRPLFTDPGYFHVTGDGTNFYGLKNTSAGRMIVAVAPSGTSSYAIQASTPLNSNMLVSSFHYGDGYVVLAGTDEGRVGPASLQDRGKLCCVTRPDPGLPHERGQPNLSGIHPKLLRCGASRRLRQALLRQHVGRHRLQGGRAARST